MSRNATSFFKSFEGKKSKGLGLLKVVISLDDKKLNIGWRQLFNIKYHDFKNCKFKRYVLHSSYKFYQKIKKLY